jgi:hypothetical protein
MIVYKAYHVFLLNDAVMNLASKFVVEIMFIYKIFTWILRFFKILCFSNQFQYFISKEILEYIFIYLFWFLWFIHLFLYGK